MTDETKKLEETCVGSECECCETSVKEPVEEKGKLVYLNDIAKRKREERVQRLLITSFHNLKGRDYEEKLDLMFEKIRKIDDAQDQMYQRFDGLSNVIEFMTNEIPDFKPRYRAFENTKHNLEEVEEGALVQAGYFIETDIGFEGRENRIPMMEIAVNAKDAIPFFNISHEMFIGMRVGEIKDIGNGQNIKIVKARRRIVKTNIKMPEPVVEQPKVEELTNDNPDL